MAMSNYNTIAATNIALIVEKISMYAQNVPWGTLSRMANATKEALFVRE